MNHQRIEQLIAQMKAEPTRVDMMRWISGPYILVDGTPRPDIDAPTTCGCIAGWTLMLFHPDIGKLRFTPHEPRTNGDISPVMGLSVQEMNRNRVYNWAAYAVVPAAAELLDIVMSPTAMKVFYPFNWPAEFERAYKDAAANGNREDMGLVTAARLRHFSRTHQ